MRVWGRVALEDAVRARAVDALAAQERRIGVDRERGGATGVTHAVDGVARSE